MRAITTGNIWGYLWSKLAYGALLFATALTDASIVLSVTVTLPPANTPAPNTWSPEKETSYA